MIESTMVILTEIQKRILKEEYPYLSLDSDSDIERYFDLRNGNRLNEALRLYNTKIIQKYPNSEKRTIMMRLYRSHDPAFQDFLQENLLDLANRTIERTKKIILLLTAEIDTINTSDAYSIIKLAEGLLSIISPDRYDSIAFADKYLRYAKILNYRISSMEKTADLLRLYVTDNLIIIQEFKKEKQQQKAQKLHKEKLKSAQHSIDLSKINFYQSDIEKICINPQIQKIEDKVIAYCLRYWNLYTNPEFEKTIFLYSKKYNTKHHDIFQAVKNGREHAWKDEEILNAVLATVVTGYYYSISGDLYLLRTWMYYKNRLETPVQSSNFININTRIKPKKQQKKLYKNKPTQLNTDIVQASSIQSIKQTHTTKRKPTKQLNLDSLKKPQQKNIAAALIDSKIQPKKEAAPIPNSIADIIRKKTGKTYTVYKDLFFRGIRPPIRSILASTGKRKNSLFNNEQNNAEEIIYNFLLAHYDNPYQNWQTSKEREQVASLGYKIDTIEPVIDKWIKDR